MTTFSILAAFSMIAAVLVAAVGFGMFIERGFDLLPRPLVLPAGMMFGAWIVMTFLDVAQKIGLVDFVRAGVALGWRDAP